MGQRVRPIHPVRARRGELAEPRPEVRDVRWNARAAQGFGCRARDGGTELKRRGEVCDIGRG